MGAFFTLIGRMGGAKKILGGSTTSSIGQQLTLR